MNKMKRWLSIALCLCMLYTSVAGELSLAWAEEGQNAVVLETVTPTAEPSGESETLPATQEATETPAVETQKSATETPAVGPQEPSTETPAAIEHPAETPVIAEAPVKPAIDYSQDASHSGAFVFGYAELLRSAKVTLESGSSETLGTLASGETVLAVDRSGDRIKVAFAASVNESTEMLTGWVDATALRPMADSEIGSVQKSALSYGDSAVTKPKFEMAEAQTNPEDPTENETTETDPTENEPATNDPANTEAPTGTEKPEAVAPVLEPKEITLKLGETDSATIAITNRDQLTGEVRFESSDEEVATVNADGVVTAVGKGACTISAIAGEAGANCAVTVYAPADDFELSVSKTELKTGERAQLSATFPQYTYGVVGYSCDTALASISSDGIVTATGRGECTITATMGDKSHTVTIALFTLPDAISVSADKTRLAVGETAKASVSLPEYTYADSVDYSSSDKNVALVDADGKITAVRGGTATITAAVGEAKADITITVFDVTLGEMRLSVGSKGQMPTTISGESTSGATYESSDESVVTVSESGLISALKVGEATVSIALKSGVRAIARIRVLAGPDEVRIAAETINIIKGQTIRVPYTLVRKDGTECEATCTLETSDASRVAVSGDMEIYARSAGAAYIRITANNGVSSIAKVVVWDNPREIYFEYGELTVKVGGSAKNRVRLFNRDGDFIYSASDGAGVGKFTVENEAVATVDQAGNVTGISTGETTLVFTAVSGMQVKARIRVLGLPSQVKLNETAITMGVGDQAKLTATYAANETGSISYASDHPEFVTVAADGTIKAVAKGAAVITATAEGGATATCAVNVVPAPAKVVFPMETINIFRYTIVKVPVKFINTDGESCTTSYTLETSAKKYVQVRDDLMYGAKTGTAYVRVTTYNGVQGIVRVKVWDKPKKLYLEFPEMQIGEGMTKQNRVNIWMSKRNSFIYDPNDGECVGTYIVENPNIATIDQAGNVTGVSKGETAICFATTTGLRVYGKVTVMAPPTTVKLNYSDLTIGVNDTVQFTASYGAYEMGTTTYTSSDPSVAKITPDGKITAVQKGTATITATTNSGVSATCPVSVVPAPAKVVFPMETINIFRYTVVKVPVEFINTDGESCTTSYTLETSAKKYVQVRDDLMYGAKAGTAYVRVTTYNGVQGIVRVRVWDKPKKLYLEFPEMQIGEGMTKQNRVNIWMSRRNSFIYDPTDGECVGAYAVDNPNIATIDQAGNVTGVSKGQTKIGFTTTTGLSVYGTVTVMVQPTTVKLNYKDLTIGVNDSAQFTASYGSYEMGTTTYVSSDPSVAKITSDGKITAVKKGKTTVTATTNSGVSATCEVTVVPAPAKVVFPMETINIFRYTIVKVPVEFINTDGESCTTSYTLETSAKKYVQVRDDLMYGAKAGTAYVRVTTYNGVQGIVRVKVWNKPQKLYLEYPDMQVGEGMTAKNRVNVWINRKNSFIYADGDGEAVGKFSTDNPKIATVDEYGNVKGISKGSTTLRFTTTTGLQVTGKVTVLSAPTSLKLNTSKTTLGVGASEQLKAQVGAYEMGTIVYSSSDSSVATVDGNGKITGRKQGAAIITAETKSASGGMLYASCSVTVVPAPDSIKLDYNYMNIALRSSVQLNATCTYQGSAECRGVITYMSSRQSIASVDQNGVVTGLKAGTATIRALLQNGMYADCQVVVRKAPTKTLLSTTYEQLGVGQSFKLLGKIYYSGGSFIYSEADTSIAQFQSSDSSIISVSADGTVTAHKPGTAYLRLYTYNGKGTNSICRVDVYAGPEWISLTEIDMELSVNQTKTLYCDRSADSVTTFSYVSSNSNVVRVSGNGESCTVYGVGVGSATVTATASNGKKAECRVTVYALPEKVAFESDTLSMGLGETKALSKVIITSSKGDCARGVSYSSSNTGIARVDNSGNVTGVAAGTAVIYAKTYNGLTAACTVNVAAAPKSVSVTAEKAQLAVGESTEIRVVLDTAGAYTLYAEDETALEVEGNTVTALKAGTAYVIAKAYNGVTGKCAIEVLNRAGSVNLTPAAITLGEGMTAELKASIPENTLAKIEYESSNEAVATVDASGTVTAVAKGSARIYARVSGDEAAYDTCEVRVKPMPAKVELSDTELNLFAGETKKLAAQMFSGEETNCYGAIEFTSSNKDVATVSESGVITAVAAGEATIMARATANEEVFAVCTVKITEANVWFTDRTVEMGVGETRTNTIHAASAAEMTIESSDSEVATMNVSGEITAMKAGQATIKVTCGADSAECVVTVKEAPESIAISSTKLSLLPGETARISAQLNPEGAAGRIEFASGDANVATVDENGLITAVGAGKTEIVARTYVEGVEAKCAITVANAPERIRFAEMNGLILSKGDNYRLEQPVIGGEGDCDQRYTLTISNSKIASLTEKDGSYEITALSAGSAILRVKTVNGKAATLKLTVVEAPTAIEFSVDALRLGVGERYAPTILGNNGSVIASTFSSDNACVRVENGSLVATAKGKATITAESIYFRGLKTTLEVEVLDMADSFRFAPDEYKMGVGENFELQIVTDEGKAIAALKYISSDESVVRVDRNGVAYAYGVGEATITGTAQNGVKADMHITVNKMATKIKLLPYAIDACLQDTVQLSVHFGEGEYANIRFDSADDSVATVDESGLVRFTGEGKTTLSAEAYNGLSDTIEVTVGKTPSSVKFEQAKAQILIGDRAQLKPVFDQDACYYELTSSNPGVISIAEDGYIEALAKGVAKITLTTKATGLTAQIEIEVIDKLSEILVVLEKETLELHETANLIYSIRPTNVLGTGKIRFESSNTNVATVDENGAVTGVAYGEAEIRAIAGDGTVGKAKVRVLGGKRRALIAYYFGEKGDRGYLSFAMNNGYSMAEALTGATVEGRKYDVCGPLSNASKSTLFARMDSHFAGTTDDDVSVLYICAHGGADGEYFFSTPNNSYAPNEQDYRISATELYNHVVKIKGTVVLVMDSCGSGGLIDALRSRLDSQGGRISILASSHADTSSSFYSVSSQIKSVDYFTFALLHGLGYNESQDLINVPHGFGTFGTPADSNGDGKVTVAEAFEYAKSLTMYMVQNKVGGKNFYGTVNQVPQSYISDKLKNLILFGR